VAFVTRRSNCRRISVLGATGSVGASTIDLVRHDRSAYEVEVLTANRDVDRLAALAREIGPRLAVVADPALLGRLRQALRGTDVECAAGPAALVEAASRPVDWVMAAIVGAAGLAPTMAAIRTGTVVAIANKECLVCAGELVTAEVARHGATLLPVDSEHNAIFQVFDFDQRDTIERIILTASGGPFRTSDRAAMARATPAEAVAHPRWSMGAKISVDSATMMNKGLEVIEAHHLFGLDESRIDVVIHPQSVVHSLVEYVDGSVLAQLGSPDMRIPIAHALAWPTRMATSAARLDLASLAQLTFERPDPTRFPALGLARRSLQTGGAAPTILNAANEVAVHAFLAGRLGFLEIVGVVEHVLARMPVAAAQTMEDVLAIDGEARSRAGERIGTQSGALRMTAP
jgi:1-deoxy-D-xylulose-5-phosphate reductoisomerase